MNYSFEGDPKLFLEINGATLNYNDGQPDMEQGLENQILLSLFTKEGWCGNIFLPPENRVSSDFERKCSVAINLSGLADIEDSAVRALTSKAFPYVDVTAKNQSSNNLRVDIIVRDGMNMSLTREGALWRNQREKT